MILNTSDDAARFVTNVSGWVDREGRFYGADERLARWSGCTHVVCECGTPVEKTYTACDACRAKRDDERWVARERRPWAGEMLFDERSGRYFSDEDEIADYCDANDVKQRDLRLVICEPDYAPLQDPGDIFSDLLPEDGDVPQDIQEAFDMLNEILKKRETPLSWSPGNYAAILNVREGESGGE